MLADGTYDVFVVDAEPLDGPDGRPGFRLDLTIVAGEAKGEVVTIDAVGLAGDTFDLLGMPGTLTVTDGSPAFRVDT